MSSGVDFSDIQRRMDGAISAFKSDLASLENRVAHRQTCSIRSRSRPTVRPCR